jgi:hypothetical protein
MPGPRISDVNFHDLDSFFGQGTQQDGLSAARTSGQTQMTIRGWPEDCWDFVLVGPKDETELKRDRSGLPGGRFAELAKDAHAHKHA